MGQDELDQLLFEKSVAMPFRRYMPNMAYATTINAHEHEQSFNDEKTEQ